MRGRTVFARMKPFNALNGKLASELDEDALRKDYDPPVRKAILQACSLIENKRIEKRDGIKKTEVQKEEDQQKEVPGRKLTDLFTSLKYYFKKKS